MDPAQALETVTKLFSSNCGTTKTSPSRVIKRITVKATPSKDSIGKRKVEQSSMLPEKTSYSSKINQDIFYEDQNAYKTCAIESCKNTNQAELQPLSFMIKRAVASIIQIFPCLTKQNDVIEELMAFMEKHMERSEMASKIPMNEFPIRICLSHFLNELGGDNTIPALVDGDPRLTPQFADCIKGVAYQLERRMRIFKENPDLLASFLPQRGQPQTPIRCGITYCPSSSLTVNPNALRLFRLFRVPQQSEEGLQNWTQMLNDKGVMISIDTLRLRTHICEMHFYRGDPKQAWEYYKREKINQKQTSTSLDAVRCVVKSCPIRGSSRQADGKLYSFISIPKAGTAEFRRWQIALDAKNGQHVFPISLPSSKICERHFKRTPDGELDCSQPVRFLRGATFEYTKQNLGRRSAPITAGSKIIRSPSMKQCCYERMQMEQMLERLEQKYNLLKMQTIHCLRNKQLEIPEFLCESILPKVASQSPSTQRKALFLKIRVPPKSTNLMASPPKLRAPSANEMPNLLEELHAIRRQITSSKTMTNQLKIEEDPFELCD